MNEWIKMSEELPEEDAWILLYRDTGEYPLLGFDIGYYNVYDNRTTDVTTLDGRYTNISDYTHWMYLPVPPKEVN